MNGGATGALAIAGKLEYQGRVFARECVESTNDEAQRLAREGAASGVVVWARQQAAGRGRRGRRWQSPEGNLYCSVIVRPQCAPARAAQLSFVAAIAVGDAVAECLGPGAPSPTLKWPNDVLIRGRKVAGILLESNSATDGSELVLVVGVGVNIRCYPDDVEFPATGLVVEGAETIAPEAVLERLLGQFDCWYERWCREGLAPIRAAWQERASGLGAPVSVRLHRETFCGLFAGLDEDGALLVKLPEGGALRRVTAGDVFFPWLSETASAGAPGAARLSL